MHDESLARYLVWYMRLMAVVYLFLGLHQWYVILDVAGQGQFVSYSLPQQVSTGYFAVINLVAAVGLWLTSSWGGVVWLGAALTDLVMHAFFSDLAMTPLFMVIFHLCSMLLYLALSVQLSRQRSL